MGQDASRHWDRLLDPAPNFLPHLPTIPASLFPKDAFLTNLRASSHLFHHIHRKGASVDILIWVFCVHMLSFLLGICLWRLNCNVNSHPKEKGVNKTRGSPTAEHMNERGDDKREWQIQVVLRQLRVFESRKHPVRKRPCSYSPHVGREQGTESGQRADPSSPARRCPLQRNAL